MSANECGSRATLIVNAEILCMDDSRTTARALVYENGIIQYIGDEASVNAWLEKRGVRFDRVDLDGHCVLPGFIDTHLHPMLMSVYEHNANLVGVSSLGEVRRLIQDNAAETQPGEWVLGLQLDEMLLPSGRLPDRHVLDEICSDRPLVVFKRDGHSITSNSLALQLAGEDLGFPPVDGGTIEYDENGRPTGVFRESAIGLIMDHFKLPSLEKLIASTLTAFSKVAACGVTSVGAILQTDAEGPSGSGGRHESLSMAALAAASPFSIYSILIGESPLKMTEFSNPQLNDKSFGHKVNAFKIFADGTLGSCTACMHQGFFDEPEKKGYLTLTIDELYRRMAEAHQQNYQICVHAIGDKAISTCIDLYERLLTDRPKADHRHRIEHASIVDPKSLKRISELNIALCCQPLFVRSEKHWLAERLGPERVSFAYPFKSFFDAGIVAAGSSDAPIEDTSVLAAIECCVTRDGFMTEECLTVDQAISMYTRNAAYIQFEEKEKGTIEVGKRADLVCLDGNPYRVAPDQISTIAVVRTICGGKVTYDKNIM